jgi:LPS sulfotransferase NodH
LTPRPIRFVILAAPRTGSNMLCTLLGSHPDVLCHHELFNPTGVYYALELRDTPFDLGTMEERDLDPLAFLERVWSADLGHSHVGFKMTHRQNETVLDAVLQDDAIRKLVLRRENRVRTYVSRLISEQTGQWEVYRDADLVPERPRVQVDLAALRQSIADDEAYYRDVEDCLRSTRQPFLPLCYEQLLEAGTRIRLLEFLDLPQPASAVGTLSVRSVRQNPEDLRALVTNFGELEAALAGTALEGDLRNV